MSFWWHQLSAGFELIAHGNPLLMELLWATVKVALVSTAVAVIVGLPIGVALGAGRFRGRDALQVLAGAGLALPSVVVGIVVLLLILPEGPLGSLRLAYTLRAVYVAQSILALPYVVVLTASAIQALPTDLIDQARGLGARRLQLAVLAVREARVGVLAAMLAALGAAVSEVGAVVIVGGGLQGRTQTLGGALIGDFSNQPNDPFETAVGLLLAGLVVVLLAGVSALQQRATGVRLRFRSR